MPSLRVIIIFKRSFNMGVIDEVKQRTDIAAVVGQCVSLQKAGRTLRAVCPFHNEKTPSFFVYPDRQSWHCFGACGTGGDVISFVMKKENMEFGDALRLLADRAGVILPSRIEKDPEKDKKERLFKVNDAAAAFFHDEFLKSAAAESARKYAAKRGITAQTIEEFQLGFAPSGWEGLKKHLTEQGYSDDEMLSAGLIIESEENKKKHDRFRGKLMFPIRDVRKRVTGFGARVLDASLPKYTNSPQTPLFDKSGTLYGINLAADTIRKEDRAVIVEGYMDVILAHQGGFRNVIASMGTAITEKHLNILKHMTTNLVLALDPDSAGEEAMLRCVPLENLLDAELKMIILPDGKDPDEVINENPALWKELVAKAVPILDFTFDNVKGKVDLKTAGGKSAVAHQLLPVVAEIKDPVRRAHYLGKLAKLTGTAESSLQLELGKQKSTGRTPAKPEPASIAKKSVFGNPTEELCLALMLRYPQLAGQSECPLPEYFDTSENREIFLAIKQGCSGLAALKEKLDEAIGEHVEKIAKTNIPDSKIEEKYTRCILDLQMKYLRGMSKKASEMLSSIRESGGNAAELAKQVEQGMDITTRMLEVTHKISRA